MQCPDLLHMGANEQWMSFQLGSHDFVPSVPKMADMLYADAKLVKVSIPRHNASKESLAIDTAAYASKNIFVRLFEFSECIKIGSPVDGPCPQQFKDYVVMMGGKLTDLQNKCLTQQVNFKHLREFHPAEFLPKPLSCLQQWPDKGTNRIMGLTAQWASHDIVQNEEEAALKNNKKN